MESESLSSHINAYLSNCFNVSELMSDAKHVNEMKDKAEELNRVRWCQGSFFIRGQMEGRGNDLLLFRILK